MRLNPGTVMQNLRGCMTVAELLESLQGCDPTAYVMFRADYGDISHTQQALPVAGHEEVSGSLLRESAYSHSRLAFEVSDDEGGMEDDEVDADLDDEDEYPQIVMLG